VLFSAEFLTNLVLCLPAGNLLCRLRPSRLGVYLATAVFAVLAWEYRGLLAGLALPAYWQGMLPDLFMAVVPLAVTALLLRRAFRGGTPGISFGPKPLRGPG